jgi:indole-3-glycerol phosphate synthase
LLAALRDGATVRVIAEIKRRSPSRGVLDERLDAAVRSREYRDGGASAISVLTEPEAFGGSIDDLRRVRAAVPLPVLKKDFHVDPVQVWEARSLGASALLLIVRALGPDGTMRLADTAREAGIAAVFEVRDEAEVGWALDAGAEIVGVNQRDLETLVLDQDVQAKLLPQLPPGCVAIAESGIRDRADVERAAGWGADAVLIGSSLSQASDAAAAVRTLCGVPRTVSTRRG